MKMIEEHPEWQRQHAAESMEPASPGVTLYRRLYRLLRRLPEVEVDAEFAEAVSARLRVAARRQRQRRSAWILLCLALSLGLAAVVGPLLEPAGRVLFDRAGQLPWPLLLAAGVALIGGGVLGSRLQDAGRRGKR